MAKAPQGPYKNPTRRIEALRQKAGTAPKPVKAEPSPTAGGFYSPADQLGYVPEQEHPPEEAAAVQRFMATVQAEAVEVDDDLTAAAEFVPEAALERAPQDERAAMAADIDRIRKMRKPLGALQLKLDLPKRRGYHRHWFNDTAGRLIEARANGWAEVLGQDKLPIKRVVGSGRDGGALWAYAMEIPLVFWEEDMAYRHQVAQDKIESLKRAPIQAKKGGSDRSDGGKFYSPAETDIISGERDNRPI